MQKLLCSHTCARKADRHLPNLEPQDSGVCASDVNTTHCARSTNVNETRYGELTEVPPSPIQRPFPNKNEQWEGALPGKLRLICTHSSRSARPTQSTCFSGRQAVQPACPTVQRLLQPKMIWEPPPGGASTRLELRSVRKLPTFWPPGGRDRAQRIVSYER